MIRWRERSRLTLLQCLAVAIVCTLIILLLPDAQCVSATSTLRTSEARQNKVSSLRRLMNMKRDSGNDIFRGNYPWASSATGSNAAVGGSGSAAARGPNVSNKMSRNVDWEKDQSNRGRGKGGKGKGLGKGSMSMMSKSKKASRKGSPFFPDCPPGSTQCLSVTDAFLVDSTTNERLQPIKLGDFLDLGVLEILYGTTDFTVECAAGGGWVGSMVLTDNFGARTIDNHAPFLLSHEIEGGYLGSIVQENAAIWTVFCQPFHGVRAQGRPGAPLLTSVVIVQGDSSRSIAPSPTMTLEPTMATHEPTLSSVVVPTTVPTDSPAAMPTISPTTSAVSSTAPSTTPTIAPTPIPSSSIPTTTPSLSFFPTLSRSPSSSPTISPTSSPAPSHRPSQSPTDAPSSSFLPTELPTMTPTTIPSFVSSQSPSLGPTSTTSPTLDCSECKTGCLSVVGFDLVQVGNNTIRRRLVEGELLQVAATPRFAIECITSPGSRALHPFEVKSALLSDNREIDSNIENGFPFLLFEDQDRRLEEDYSRLLEHEATQPPEHPSYNNQPSSLFENPGEWIVNCQAFCGINGNGDASEPFSLSFFVERIETGDEVVTEQLGNQSVAYLQDTVSLDKGNGSLSSEHMIRGTRPPKPTQPSKSTRPPQQTWPPQQVKHDSEYYSYSSINSTNNQNGSVEQHRDFRSPLRRESRQTKDAESRK